MYGPQTLEEAAEAYAVEHGCTEGGCICCYLAYYYLHAGVA